jgi:hypothetical protein
MGLHDPLGPHPGGPTAISVNIPARNPVRAGSPTSRRSRGYAESQEMCHEGVIPEQPQTHSKSPIPHLCTTIRTMIRISFPPTTAKHLPDFRKPGTPLEPTTHFHGPMKYRPLAPVSFRQPHHPRSDASRSSNQGNLIYRRQAEGSMRYGSQVGLHGVE